MNNIFNTVIFILIFIFFTKETQAYIDLGSGSFFLQIIIGGILGALFVLKIYFRKTKKFFSKIINKKSKNDK